MTRRKMSLQSACDLVPDDLPDGAFFAMAHEIAGADYGSAWDELESSPTYKPFTFRTIKCRVCHQKFATNQALGQHAAAKHKELK